MTREALAALGGRRIGLHLPLAGGMVKAADRAAAIGATAMQVFSDNPTAWRRRAEPPAELPAFRERLAQLDIAPLSIHGPYLVNLAGTDDEFWMRSVATLIADMAMAVKYGARYLNIHVGSHRGHGPDAGISRLAAGLAAVFAEIPRRRGTPLLVLENSAGGGDGVGGTIEELARMLDAAGGAGVRADRIGFCLDTAHLWGAGYEISRPEVVDEVLERFDSLLGRERLAMVHLNDSRSELGSHTDRHEHVGAGVIGARGLTAFLAHPRLAATPLFAEPPGMDEGYDAINMERIRMLIRGEELPPLPSEAFQLRGRTKAAHPGATKAPAAPKVPGPTKAPTLKKPPRSGKRRTPVKTG